MAPQLWAVSGAAAPALHPPSLSASSFLAPPSGQPRPPPSGTCAHGASSPPPILHHPLPPASFHPPRSAHARRAPLRSHLALRPSFLPPPSNHLAQRIRTRRLFIPTPPSPPLLPESRPPPTQVQALLPRGAPGGAQGRQGPARCRWRDTGCAGKAISPRSLSAWRSADKVSEERA